MQLIGGELFADELVERFVVVERANHVIAVGIGKGSDPGVAVHQHAILGVGIAGDVEPVAAPAFAVPWRGEQVTDELREGFARGRQLLGGRWQAVQVKRRAADQRRQLRRFGRFKTPFAEFAIDQLVDRIRIPFDHGRGDRLERPVVARRRFDIGDDPRAAPRVDGPLADPGNQVGDLLVAQLFARVLGGHFQVGIAMGHDADQQARRGIAGDDGRSAFAPPLPAAFGIQPQVRIGLVVPMATLAAIDQQRSDLFFEKRFAISSLVRLGRSQGTAAQQQAHAQPEHSQSDRLASQKPHNHPPTCISNIIRSGTRRERQSHST